MDKNRVAFIFHPLNIQTALLMLDLPLDGTNSHSNKEMVKQTLETKEPFVLDEIKELSSALKSKIDLVCIVCPLLPEQIVLMDEKFVLNKIIQSVNLAEKLGSSLAVLAGFTSIVGNEGVEVSKRTNIPITTGNTYTGSLAIEGVKSAANLIGLDLSGSKCAIIGATGDIGSSCAKFFSKVVLKLSLLARNHPRLDEFAGDLRRGGVSQIEIHKKTFDAIRGADIIITATSSLTTLIEPAMLKPGAIICDVSLPPNIAREVGSFRKDILVFEGGLAKIPSYEKIQNSKLRKWWTRNAIYGCLAEGLILGFERRAENFSLGRGCISESKMDDIKNSGTKHGFGLADFCCGDKTYSNEDIDFLKEIISKRVSEKIDMRG